MKMHGKQVRGVNRDVVVFPRPDGNLAFTGEAIQNWEEFEKLCPMPVAPVKILPGGIREANTQAESYRKKLNEWGELKTNYMVIKTLAPTEGLEWETVVMDKPETWGNWRKELEDSGFIENEVVRLLRMCSNVNAISEEMMDRARESFLLEARQSEK